MSWLLELIDGTGLCSGRLVAVAGARAGRNDVGRNVGDGADRNADDDRVLDEPLPHRDPPNDPPVTCPSADEANRTTARNAEIYLAGVARSVFMARLYQTEHLESMILF